jgi:hypothetical protein
MKRFKITAVLFLLLALTICLLPSCKDFFNPSQDMEVTEDKLYDDWYEYRSVAMGIYAIQKELVEQLLVLGELRGDLLTITDNADSDMVEIYNFNISKNNKYASPLNFFKLISACNNLLNILQTRHPEVMDPKIAVTNYDRLYGEALCIRAWAYFNAVRIYGKVPFIPESITTVEEIDSYINTPGIYIDSINTVYGIDGFNNDTLYNTPIELTKQFFNQNLVIDYFTQELLTKVKAVGVNHYVLNNDATWEVTIWNSYSTDALLGLMYLTDGDLFKAAKHFEKIIFTPSDNARYQLDATFGLTNWENIFTSIDRREHIYTLWFSKNFQQKNQLQELFDIRKPHEYMLKPSRKAVLNWETIWDDYTLNENLGDPSKTKIKVRGIPGDFSRGYGVSYAYFRNGQMIPEDIVKQALLFKADNDFRTSDLLLEDVDTVVWKYSINKGAYDEDANFNVYRAAGVHLWLAEIYVYWAYEQNGVVRPLTTKALQIVNDGANFSINASRVQKGVRGRVGYGGLVDGIKAGNYNYIHNPFNNEVVGYIDLTGDFLKKQLYIEDQIVEEKARELAFEGERFYDLVRVAKRRNDPSYLAGKISQKFPEGKRQEIYNYLLDENNWYINYFE